MANSAEEEEAPAAALELREAHFPGRAPIEAYGNGGFRFAGMSHRGSLLCLPSGIYAWDVSDHSQITAENLKRLFDEAGEVEVLLAGTGLNLVPLNKELMGACRGVAISADPMATGAAVRTYNVLVSEGRAVAAALLAVG